MTTSALRLLLALKLKGVARKQVRRLKRPSGILFALFGLVVFVIWLVAFVSSIAFRNEVFQGAPISEDWIPAVCLVLFVMTVTASFNHRGIYLPTEELERLLASPVSRSDLVRYRLLASSGRYLFSGLIFGFISAQRVSHPVFGFFGVLLSMLTLPLVGQFSSLVFGALEERIGGFFRKGRFPFLRAFSGGLIAILFMAIMFGDELTENSASLDALYDHASEISTSAWFQALLTPFHPWSRMISATSASTFVPWFATCVAIWFALFELTARLPVDFRELALETSANIAKRIRSVQRGGFGASAGKASIGTFVRRVPWIFGRGAFGAVAWVKLSSIARKAKGTLTISALIISLVTVASVMLFGEPIPEDTLRGAALVAGFGTLYLCGGLRFDFRTDLDRMEAIKSWPLRPSLVFLANLLPQVLLVTSALSLAIVVRTIVTGGYELLIVPILAGIPLLTLAWMALDNAVFLFAPVRYVAGQEGMLQHMGRSMILMLVRILVGFTAAGLSAAAGWSVWIFTDGLERDVRVASTAVCVGAVVLLVDVLLVLVGGVALRRFDVSRIPK